MLPVGAKPAIHLIVEEALSAGADEAVIVISPEKEIIRRYFDGDPELAPRIRWILQTEQRGLGHAVLQGAPILAGEKDPVLVLLGDALVSGETPSSAMSNISRAMGGASVVGLEEVPLEKVSRYGIVKCGPAGTSATDDGFAGCVWKLDDMVEKPSPESAPSRLAIAGRYLLDPAIFDLLATQKPGYGGEIQLTDAIRRLMAERPVYGYRYPGRRHDIGNPTGYLETLEAFSC